MSDFMEKLMKYLGKLRESHLEDMMVRNAVPELFNLLLEQVLLDVLSLDRLIPFEVKSVDIGNVAANVFENSVNFSHLLHVGVA